MKDETLGRLCGNGMATIERLASREKDHQHADGDDDQRREDQQQIGALRVLAAAVVGVFIGTVIDCTTKILPGAVDL